MGGKSSKKSSADNKAEKKASEAVDNALYQDRAVDSQTIKLLLLGAGESGKSTLFKQMQKLYTSDGFTKNDLALFAPRIFNNVLEAGRELLGQTERLDGCALESDQAVAGAAYLRSQQAADAGFCADLATHVAAVWGDAGAQRAYARRSEFQLIDTAGYFFDHVARLCEPGYLPTDDDVIRCRVRTTGIVEMRFEIDHNRFLIVDVGGQRNERRKWIHCFEEVTAVIFVAALSGYDQTLYEDNRTNRMDEALTLFDEVCQYRCFEHTNIILFLNKVDLFEEKMATKPFTLWTPAAEAFSGQPEPTTDDAIAYLRGRFSDLYHDTHTLYVHVTCATNTDNIQVVFNAVKDIVIQQHLAQSGLI